MNLPEFTPDRWSLAYYLGITVHRKIFGHIHIAEIAASHHDTA
jgi:hypothetical protein